VKRKKTKRDCFCPIVCLFVGFCLVVDFSILFTFPLFCFCFFSLLSVFVFVGFCLWPIHQTNKQKQKQKKNKNKKLTKTR